MTNPVCVAAEVRQKLVGSAVVSQLIRCVVVLPIAIPVSPVTPLSVTTAVFVAGNWIMQPVGAGSVGNVIVLAPDCNTTSCTWRLAAAEVIVSGPIVLEPVGEPWIAPLMVIVAAAAIVSL